MTVQHNTPPAETPPGFGDIPINRAPQTLAGKPARRSPRQPARPPKKKSAFILLLVLISTAVLLYFAAVLLVLPMLIKGPVATKIGNRLNRPVQVESVSLSPFNFSFHLAGINIGPAPDRKGDIPLCTVPAVDGRLQPASLLQGKVVLADVQITRPAATLIRSARSSPVQLLQSSAGNSAGTILPSWLLIQGLKVIDGTLNFQDQSTSRQHTINKIQLNLPTGSTAQKSSEPTLQAMINSSPISLQGRRRTNSDGSTETRLSLQLKNIDLQQAVSSLPDTLHNLSVQGDNAEADFEIILKNTTSTGMKIIVNGTVNATNLTLLAPDQEFTLKVPTVQMLFKARPLANLYSITSLTAVAPELALAATQPAWPTTVQTILCRFLSSSTVGMSVDQLKIDQGTLAIDGGSHWQDLRLQLTNLHNTAAGKSEQPAALTLQASRANSTVEFQGEITPDHALAGKLSLLNMEANRLQSLLPGTGAVRFDQGLLQLEGMLRTQQDTPGQMSWQITDSSLQVSNFSLQQQDLPWAVGKKISGSQCLLQSSRSTIDCQQISFSQTNFFPPALALLDPAGKDKNTAPRFLSFDTLKVQDSTADLPLLRQMRLTDLQLNLSGMKQTSPRPENLSVKGRLGEQGQLDITGRLQHNGQGILQLSASGIDVNILPAALFADWLVPEVHQGTVQLNGKLKIPELRLAGNLQINDFIAGPGSVSVLRWQQAAASDLTAQLTPFSASVGQLVLDQPSITLPKGKGKLPADLLTLLQHNKNGEPILPVLSISECIVNNGSLSSSEHVDLTNIEGTIAPLQRNTPAEFTLAGQMDGAAWIATGQRGLQSGKHTLQVKNSPFSPAVEALFADSFQLDTDWATADLTVSTTDPGTIRLTGIAPLPGSDFALLLALLTDQTNSVILQLPALDDISPAVVLTKTVPPLLSHLRLQAAVAPRLIIDTLLPVLNLPRTVEFLPGETVPDFMAGLKDYPALLALRPHLVLAVRGSYDDTADRQSLMRVLQEEADAQRELGNIRREQLRAQLTAEKQQLASRKNPPPGSKLRLQEQLKNLQPLPQVTVELLPETLPNLARQRAEVLRHYLINTLQIPEEKIQILPNAAKGARTEIILQPVW